MVKHLSEVGLVEHVPYRGAQLSPHGRQAALRVIRRHRVLELYLTRDLGYDWSNVHDEAERLEHDVSDHLINRIADALGNPRYDPHGEPISTDAGEIEEPDLTALAEAPVGRVFELRQVETQDPARLRFLAEAGLVPGVTLTLTVTDRQPFNGPTMVRLGIALRVVGRDLALLLWCREVVA